MSAEGKWDPSVPVWDPSVPVWPLSAVIPGSAEQGQRGGVFDEEQSIYKISEYLSTKC